MARKAKIHMYFGTCVLPKRDLNDWEVAHDVIEVNIGDNEVVQQMDLELQKGTYRRRMETQEEADKRAGLVESSRADVAALGGVFTGDMRPIPKMINERLKDMETYRYRLVTLEQSDALDSPSEEIQDAVEVPAEGESPDSTA